MTGDLDQPLAHQSPPVQDDRKRQVRAAQVRLLYRNAATGIAVTTLAATVVAYIQWGVVGRPLVVGWLSYMLLVALARAVLTRRFWRTSPDGGAAGRWGTAFTVGAGMAAAGWGAAGILLYSDARLLNQVFLVFVLGGMMLGGASLLASRSEAFLAFLLPTGLLPALRLLSQGGEQHLIMGLLAILFTGATLATTWQVYRTIERSLNLRFENQDLLEDLRRANSKAEALNQQLERRVQSRTAELEQSTERLRAEIKQREQTEEELLRARKLESLGVIAGGIAHDFNNFLTIIQGNLELARMELLPDSPVTEILDQTKVACRRAVFLSTQLLTFSKGGSPVRRVVSVAGLITDAVRLARAGASVGIQVNVADDLWPAEVDADQIAQVLHNILLNAKQAMSDGGTIEVLAENVAADPVRASRPGACVRISVRDHGGGIAADVLPLIFDPYFTTKRTGSGLGLATAYAIVSKHGGWLGAQSEGLAGTVFVIELPASQAAPAPEATTTATTLRSGAGRILVMDDETAIRRLLTTVLTRLGYEVTAASDGAEATNLYQAAHAAGHGFDAVLLDLTVTGGMGGVEAAAKLKEFDPAVKLIASSGYSDAPVMANFRAYGFDDVISKPWSPVQMSDVLRRVLAADGIAGPDRRT